MLKRLYRILIVFFTAAAGLGVAAVVYLQFYYNRLAVTNLFVDFSSFVLLAFLLILITRYTLLLWFSYLQHIEAATEPPVDDDSPFVSIVVPAHNEGPVIEAALESIMRLDYEEFEAIVVDDGSTDDTYRVAERIARTYGPERVSVIRQANAGKAAALNRGIAAAHGELVLCMDADSRLEPQTVRQMVRHFADWRVGAVAGNVKVVNRLNFLTRLQALEYIEGLNLLRAAQAFFRMTTVIPGPVGMFRRNVLRKLEGYRSDTFAEDCELTLRIVLNGYKIKYEGRAIAWTEAPESTQALFKQRYRWTRGILQAIIRHRGALAHPWRDFMNFAFLSLLIFESVAMPAMNVFGMIFFSCAAVWGGLSQLLFLWWAQLAVLDIVAALFCVAMEKEQISLVLYALPYRLFFVPYVDVMRFFAGLDETFAVEMVWGRLQRAGRI